MAMTRLNLLRSIFSGVIRSPLRPRNLGLFLFAFVCTIVFFTLRTDVRFQGNRSDRQLGHLSSRSSAEQNLIPEVDSSVRSPNECYQVSPLTCIIDSKVSPGCYLINNVEAVVPLGLIKKHYQVYGGVSPESSTLYVHHTNVEIPSPEPDRHEATGRYMFFQRYNVESRPRVKLLIADEGIPISTQWDPKGYPYAIQIAQFGLSHYTKLLDLKRNTRTSSADDTDAVLVDFDVKRSISQKSLVVVEGQSNWRQEVDGSLRFFATRSHMDTAEPLSYLKLRLLTNATWRYFVLAGRQWRTGSTVTIRLLWSHGRSNLVQSPRNSHLSSGTYYDLSYSCNSAPSKQKDPYLSVFPKEYKATFWMPRCSDYSRANDTEFFRIRLARDLFLDLLKVFGSNHLGLVHIGSHQIQKDEMDLSGTFDSSKLRVYVHSISLEAGSIDPHGGGLIDELRLGISHKELPTNHKTVRNVQTELLFHEYRFMAASSWFRSNQHSDGAWKIPVARHFRGRALIEPGWPSAMGQGHGLSLLVRAHNYTGDLTYLQSAQYALHVYNISVTNNGIRSLFLDQESLPWYEEYPTEPGNFVLNGFIYSLIGLYDLSQVESRMSPLSKSNAVDFLESGLTTLSSIAPLFDSGTGSFYDLRHVMQPMTRQTIVSRSPSTYTLGLNLEWGPNRARWDYHAVHIRQLRILSTLDHFKRAKQWRTLADRWTAYMSGFRSLHN